MKCFYKFLFLSVIFFACSKDHKSLIIHTASLPDGRQVNLYHLENKNGISVDVSEYGATIVNIFTPDKKGNLGNIVAGYDSMSTYFNDQSYFGCIVGRVANRIANGKFTLDTIEYTLQRNEGGINHIHGGKDGFHKKLWKGETFVNEKGQSVRLTYASPDGEEGYPGNLKVTVTYSLNDSNEFHISYDAVTDKPTIVNLSNHSYFNLSGLCDSTVLGHLLQINADQYLPVNKNLIPLGASAAVHNTPFDFRTPKAIGRDIGNLDSQLMFCNGGYDHNFVLNHQATGKGLNFVLRLSEPVSGRVIEMYSDQPGLQFYSGNFFDGSVRGKKGCRYKKYSFLVFETQKFPDSPNHPDYPSVELRPGQTYQHNTVLKFKTVQ